MRMVERVARAIHDAECTCGTWREPATKEQMSTFFAPFSKTHYHSEDSIEGWVEVARAAIEAMREPNDAMLEVANALPVTAIVNGAVAMVAMRYAGGNSGLEGPPNTPLQQWWRAMIDAALRD